MYASSEMWGRRRQPVDLPNVRDVTSNERERSDSPLEADPHRYQHSPASHGRRPLALEHRYLTTRNASKCIKPRTGTRGVTLFELMIVVLVIGIMAAIAVPGYRKYMIRTQRSEAKIALLHLQTAQEKRYLQQNSYTDDVTGSPAANPPGLGLPGMSETQKYDITATLNDAGGQTYTATATPKYAQADDSDCMDFTINERGVRNNTGPLTPETCWK
jgi:type IV pilus assembly protein PilE